MKKIVLTVLVCCIGLLGLLWTNNSIQGQQNQQDDNDEPTVVNSGRPRTKKEKAYSKDHSKRFGKPRVKLTDVVKQAKIKSFKGDIVRVHGIPSVIGLAPPPVEEHLKELVCKSDAILVGSSMKKTSHLTEDESSIYTEYDLFVKDVLKNNSTSPINVGTTVQINRPGGSIKLDGQVIRIRESAIESLKKNKEYVLFLRYLPDGGQYLIADPRTDYELNGTRFRKISKVGYPEDYIAKDSKMLIERIRSSVSVNCGINTRGGSN